MGQLHGLYADARGGSFLGLENRKSKELHGRDSVIASANGAGEAGPVAFSDVAPSSAQVGPGRCNSDLGGRSVPVELPILPKRVAENVGQFTGRAWLLPKIWSGGTRATSGCSC